MKKKELNNIDIIFDFPHMIKTTRKALGETQEKFGSRFSVSGNTIWNWENGKDEAKYEILSFCLEYFLFGKSV